MASLTRHYVSDDVSLFVYDQEGLGLQIHSCHEVVAVAPAELPALLAALEQAAAEMGVETARAELVKACELLVAYCHQEHAFLSSPKFDGVIRGIEQALDKAK